MASVLKNFTSLARQTSRACLRNCRLNKTSSLNLRVLSSQVNNLRTHDIDTRFRQFNTSSVVSTVRVQHAAPNFSATAVVDGQFKDVQLSDFKGKYLVLFFYPLDFTFVCPTEIIAFSENIEKFRELDAQVIGVSTDSQFSHLAWINTPRKDGGLGGLKYPLLSDFSKQISRDYDVLLEKEGVALRGLFVIDPNSIVRQITVNDLPVGRSVDETLRLIQAFQFTDKHGEVCPANWRPESETIKPTPDGSKEYFQKVNK